MEQTVNQTTNLSALGALFLVCMLVLTWRLPRGTAVLPLLVTTCYMPLGQMFVIAGLHFQLIRIVVLAAWCRVLLRGETKDFRLTKLDKLFVCWAAATLVLGTLAEPTSKRLINRCGEVYNALGGYFLLRCWVQSLDDVIDTVRFLAVMIIPLAALMLVEKFTRHNLFSVFGGVPEITELRDGHLRCQGAFRHPILAGTYAATLFPLVAGLWFAGRQHRWRSVIGCLSAGIITVASASSGALLALIGVVAGFGAWRLRDRMKMIRWTIVLTIVGLALVMKAPVWYLISRVSDLFGGTGWHRSYLIDQAVGHFGEWWLVGSTYTAHWAPSGQVLAVDPNNMDITNHYIAEGLGGGVVKLGLFLWMIVLGFKTAGRSVRYSEPAFGNPVFVWSIGVCLLAHCVSFISISYFDQLIVMWYWLLAVFAMMSAQAAAEEIRADALTPEIASQ